LRCSFITRHRSHASEEEEKKRRGEKRRGGKRGKKKPKQVNFEEKDSGTVIAKTVYVSVS
jgi:hypothetical protein